MKINITGDFCITSEYLDKELFEEQIVNFFNDSDYNIVNLECPIVDKKANPILKTGPNLKTDDRIIKHLIRLNIDAVTLANNHILDYGTKGLSDTFDLLEKNKIGYVGAGNNLTEASKPLTIEHEGMKVAILNFCESEWSIAEKNLPGANPMDIISNTKQIKEAKDIHDKVICIVHGGNEYYQLPSPRMAKQYRYFVDCGADAVIGHHTHCISGQEIYNDSPIVYSLGNFLFTRVNANNLWYSGLISQLFIKQGQKIKIVLVPVEQKIKYFKLSFPINKDKEKMIKRVNELSGIISNNEKLKKYWDEFINSKRNKINIFSPINIIRNRYIRSLLFRIYKNKLISNKQLISLINNVRCEAHYDLVLELLRKEIDLRCK